MAQKGIEIPPYSDIQEAEDTPYDPDLDPDCDLDVEDVQAAIDELCKQMHLGLVSVKCVTFGTCHQYIHANRLLDQSLHMLRAKEC